MVSASLQAGTMMETRGASVAVVGAISLRLPSLRLPQDNGCGQPGHDAEEAERKE